MNAILLFGFLFNGIRILTGAFIVFYMLNKGVSIVEIGIIKSAQALTMMLVDIPLGYFADKKSYKLSIVLAALASTIWLVLMGLSSGFYGFLTAEIFNALSLSLIAGAYNALLVQYSKAKSMTTKHVIARSSQWNYIGMFVFSLIGAYLADYSIEYIWYFAALLMFITTLFGFIGLEDLKGEVGTSKKQNVGADMREMVSVFISIPNLSILFGLGVIFFNVFSQYWQWLFKSDSITVSYSELGIIFSIILLAQLLASFVFARVKIGHNYIIVASMIAMVAISYTGLEYIKILAIILVAVVFFAIRYTGLYLEVLLHDNIADNLRATYESCLSTIVRGILLVTFTLSAFVVEYFGFVFLIYFFALFIIYFLACTLRKKVKLSYS